MESDSDVSFKVVGFLLTMAGNDSLIEAYSKDEYFTVEQKLILRAAPNGSHLYLEEVRVHGPTGGIHARGVECVCRERMISSLSMVCPAADVACGYASTSHRKHGSLRLRHRSLLIVPSQRTKLRRSVSTHLTTAPLIATSNLARSFLYASILPVLSTAKAARVSVGSPESMRLF
jgi:hypothetical protein